MKKINYFFKISSLLLYSSIIYAQDCLIYGEKGMTQSSNHRVDNYNTEFLSCNDLEGNKYFSIRQFQLNGKKTQLVVEPNSLKTSLMKSSCLVCSVKDNKKNYNDNYSQLIKKSISPPYPLKNDGLVSGVLDEAIALTIDMCPSSRGISKKVYDKLIEISEIENKEFPIAIAMTKSWMDSHPNLFKWLKTEVFENHFDIVWVNHSSTHPYKKNQPSERNFLLSPEVNFYEEVIKTEIALIKAGVTPSVFFRFPGLVSSRKQIEILGQWGILPLGADAWLAKGDNVQDGSIILIHGNRNEVKGEQLLFNYIEQKSTNINWVSLYELLVDSSN